MKDYSVFSCGSGITVHHRGEALNGGAENAGRENDGREIAGHEIAGHKKSKRAGYETDSEAANV